MSARSWTGAARWRSGSRSGSWCACSGGAAARADRRPRVYSQTADVRMPIGSGTTRRSRPARPAARGDTGERPRTGAHRPVIDPSARVHGTADLEADVSVGPRTSIWHRAQIRTGARIGADCVIGRDAFIDEGVTLGDRVKVQNAALVYHGVTVEDGVFIGPNAIL